MNEIDVKRKSNVIEVLQTLTSLQVYYSFYGLAELPNKTKVKREDIFYNGQIDKGMCFVLAYKKETGAFHKVCNGLNDYGKKKLKIREGEFCGQYSFSKSIVYTGKHICVDCESADD